MNWDGLWLKRTFVWAWRSHRHYNPQLPITNLPTFVYTTYTGPRFSTDVRGRVWEGATVTNLALQMAYHMGIEKAILIVVDHNFASKGDANKTVASEGDDPNHFMPNYFGKGVKWQLPDLDTSKWVISWHVKPTPKLVDKWWMPQWAAN